MIHVVLTRHLFAFFPALEGQEIRVEAATVADAVRSLEALAPGIAHYLVDETGRLRPHVNAFIGNSMIRDRRRLTDPLAPGDKLSILQSLSGG